jgi:hypothetical protein
VKNVLLQEQVRAKIDARVERILRELGNPPPPLKLEDVRELLKLNREYFTGDDDSLVARTLSRLKIGTKQALRRPTLLVDAIRKFDLKALYLPDTKRIMIDSKVPEKKHRWLEAHEIGHGLLPWHQPFMFGDDEHTPTPACHSKLENEASYAGGQMLFLRQRFIDDAQARPAAFSSLQALHKAYGNTMTTTLWRYVEHFDPKLPMVGIISGHPHPSQRVEDFDATAPCRYFIQSAAFATRFGQVEEHILFADIAGYCGRQRGGPLGKAELVLRDDNGEDHIFVFETFFNRHDALTLGVYSHRAVVAVGF